MSALSNARWLILIQGYKIALQLVSMSVLTRLLPPSDYGLMAMAWTAANLASLLRDLGTSSAIIQKQELNEETKSTVFWLHMSLGCLLAITLIAMSGIISSAFKQPALAAILCWLALTFPLGSLSAIHQALLERQSKFQTLARVEIVASTASLLVAVVAALNGAGVYSFLWQSFTLTLLYVVQPWFAVKWFPRFVWDRAAIKAIFGFSGNLSAFNLINFISRNADSMIIGRFLGASALGTYSMAYKLMLFPLQNLTFVASRALFPVMSREQDSNAAVAALYVRAVAMVSAISTPLMAGLYILREPLVALAFGGQWGDVAPVIAWLAPVGAIQSIVSTTGSIYMAKGRTDLLFRIGVLATILTISAFAAGLSRGVIGVASLYFFANVLTFFPQTYIASRIIDLPYRDFLKSLGPSLLCTGIMAPVVLFALHETKAYGDLFSLLFSSVAGALTYSFFYWLLFRNRMMELLQAVFGSKLMGRNRAQSSKENSNTIQTWIFVDLATDFGGHEVMLLRWISELRKDPTVKPVLVCLQNTRLAREANDYCQLVQVRGTGERQGLFAKLGFLARLCLLFIQTKRTMRPELAIIAEGCLFAQRYGLYAARLTRLYCVLYTPLVARFSSMSFQNASALEKRVKNFYGKLPNAWLTITNDQAEEFRAWSLVKQPIFTLPNTIKPNIEGECATMSTAKERRADGRMHVLVLGRLDHHQKGLDLLLEHLKNHPELSEEFVIHFVGEGPFADILLKEKRNDSRLDQLIQIEPWADPLEVFAKSDALLLPSRYEGVPLVMLEAMACGLPILASDLAGTRAYLPMTCLFPVGRIDKAFEHLSAMRRSKTRATRVAARNLAAFKMLASGAAFASAVEALTVNLRSAVHMR